MTGLGDAIDWGKKILQINGRIDENAKQISNSSDDIVSLKRQIRQLGGYVKNLKHQLDLERQKNISQLKEHQYEIKQYQTELNSYKTELALKLKEFEIQILKGDISRQEHSDKFLSESSNLDDQT